MQQFKKNSGSSLIEVIVVATILSAVSLTFLGSFAIISRFHEKNMLLIKSELLAEEGMEAVRLIKGGSWSTIASLAGDGYKYLGLATSTWGVTTTPDIIDGLFYRSFRVSPVSRDSNSDIVSTGGTIDNGTVKIDVKVEWQWRRSTTTATYEAYMTNI